MVKRRLHILSLVALLVLACGETALATTAIVPRDSDMVVESRAIVTGRVIGLSTGVDAVTDIVYTYVRLQVNTVLKGTVTEREIVLKEMGGETRERGTQIFGMPRFEAGQEVLLYLNTWPDGALRVHQGFLGKFNIIRESSTGRAYVERQMEGENIIIMAGSGDGTNRSELGAYTQMVESLTASYRKSIRDFDQTYYSDIPMLAQPGEYQSTLSGREMTPLWVLLNPSSPSRWFEPDSNQPRLATRPIAHWRECSSVRVRAWALRWKVRGRCRLFGRGWAAAGVHETDVAVCALRRRCLRGHPLGGRVARGIHDPDVGIRGHRPLARRPSVRIRSDPQGWQCGRAHRSNGHRANDQPRGKQAAAEGSCLLCGREVEADGVAFGVVPLGPHDDGGRQRGRMTLRVGFVGGSELDARGAWLTAPLAQRFEESILVFEIDEEPHVTLGVSSWSLGLEGVLAAVTHRWAGCAGHGCLLSVGRPAPAGHPDPQRLRVTPPPLICWLAAGLSSANAPAAMVAASATALAAAVSRRTVMRRCASRSK